MVRAVGFEPHRYCTTDLSEKPLKVREYRVKARFSENPNESIWAPFWPKFAKKLGSNLAVAFTGALLRVVGAWAR
jgi:hypothetical protein